MTTGTTVEQIVFASQKFSDVLEAARRLMLRFEFDTIEWDEEIPNIDWGFALLYASAITSVRSERAQAAVLRVATACIMSQNAEGAHKAAAAALLERSGNHLAVDLAESRDRLPAEAWRCLPAGIRLDVIRSRIEYSLQLAGDRLLPVNPFQADFWQAVETKDWLSVSAPTSAGKSRIIREYFLEVARQARSFMLVYLVPTRALIEEVSRDLRREVPSDVAVFTMPWDPELAESSKTVLVVTQERLHLALELFPTLKVKLLFIDEAQSLAGGARGVLLQDTIERTVRRNPDMQVLFASPLTSNPELLVEDVPSGRTSGSFVSETVTVNQNLVWVEAIKGKPQRRAIFLLSDGNKQRVGELQLADRARKVPVRMALIAHALAGNTPGNVIYVNGASEAEKVAKAVFDQLRPLEGNDEEIDDLRELIKTAVHSKYSLADFLTRRVAFHYGNMPLVVRAEIERLFGEGKIYYLVCTSTLLEGVNLPCRTVFMRNPKKGQKNPFTEGDFWNLAGRAGRWGREFQGNVVCIDTDGDVWAKLPRERKRSTITRAVSTGLEEASSLLKFVRATDVVSDDVVAESLFAYLCSRHLAGESNQVLLDRVPLESERSEIESAVERAAIDLKIPVDIVSRHTGISLFAMERLLDSFRQSGKSPTDLALPLPQEPDARERFQRALVRIGSTMTNAFGVPTSENDRRKWQLANLIVNWMKGMPLARLIDQRVANEKDKDLVAKAIRYVMQDVESIARFYAPKYLACYADLLAVYSKELGIEAAPWADYAMMLELGVSRKSELVLMSLGLSRTATVALSEFIGVDEWTRTEALEWLAVQNLDGLGMPVLLQREINHVLEIASKRSRSASENE